jgi:hypothetical protein
VTNIVYHASFLRSDGIVYFHLALVLFVGKNVVKGCKPHTYARTQRIHQCTSKTVHDVCNATTVIKDSCVLFLCRWPFVFHL